MREVQTLYGKGTIERYRHSDQIYLIRLPFGTLSGSRSVLVPEEGDTNYIMKLNAAYDSLEQMRKNNLEVVCKEKGVQCCSEDLDCSCRTCLLQSEPRKTKCHPALKPLQKFIDDHNRRLRRGQPCLTCGNIVCRNHASKSFRKQGLQVCCDCERIFTVDFVLDCLVAPSTEERREQMDKLIDLYDRVTLLLKYSVQFTEDVASQLDDTKIITNKVGVGSSSAGVVGGVLGVAAAATMMTPVGTPLLLVSLLFGGGATIVQTGNQVRNHMSEPSKVADRILALFGMTHAILNVMSTLRDALTRDYIRKDMYIDDSIKGRSSLIQEPPQVAENHARVGLTAGRTASAGVELSVALSTSENALQMLRSARLFAKGSSGLARTVQFARFAGGALSGVLLLLEARSLTLTIQNILKGSPCEKAESLRKIEEELEEIPSTAHLDRECRRYLDCMESRQRLLTEQEAVQLLLDAFHSESSSEEEHTMEWLTENDHSFGSEYDFMAPFHAEDDIDRLESNRIASLSNSSLPEHTDDPPPDLFSSSDCLSVSSSSDMSLHSSSTASLLERIQRYKEQETSLPNV